MSEIISIKGQPFIAPGTPRPDMIEELEKILQLAKDGQIDGMAVVCLYPNNTTNYRTAGRLNRAILGTISMMQFRLLYDDMKEDE